MIKTLTVFLDREIQVKLVDGTSHTGKVKQVSPNLLVLDPELYAAIDKIVYFRSSSQTKN